MIKNKKFLLSTVITIILMMCLSSCTKKEPEVVVEPEDNAGYTKYVSADSGLTFDYPETWHTSEQRGYGAWTEYFYLDEENHADVWYSFDIENKGVKQIDEIYNVTKEKFLGEGYELIYEGEELLSNREVKCIKFKSDTKHFYIYSWVEENPVLNFICDFAVTFDVENKETFDEVINSIAFE